MLWGRWRVAFGSFGVAACTAFGSSDPPAQPAIPTDGGSPEAGTSPNVDAATALDGSTIEPAAHFCASRTGLCVDFDGANGSEWAGQTSRLSAGPTGSELTEIGSGKSGSNGLRSVLTISKGPATLARVFSHAGTGDLRVEADVLIEKPTDTTGAFHVAILKVIFGSGSIGPTAEAQVGPAPDGANLALRARDSTDAVTATLIAPQLLPYNEWVHIVLEAGLANGANGFVRVSSDKTDSVQALDPPREAVAPTGPTQTFVGLVQHTGEPMKGLAVRIDNVVATPR